MGNEKQVRRPSTKTITRVVDWLESQGLSVYGAFVDFKRGTMHPGCMDYSVQQILKLAALNKKYPKGIPRSDDDDD